MKSPRFLSKGHVFHKHWVVQHKLGQGSLGPSYLAVHQDSGQRVTLKLLDVLRYLQQDRISFERALTQSQTITHPNVAALLDFGYYKSLPFAVFEYIDGLPLASLAQSKQDKKLNFSVLELEPLVQQLCDALKAVHEHSLHGNIHAGNIILLPDKAMLTDTALVAAMGNKQRQRLLKLHQDRQWLPEYGHSKIDQRADIFSLSQLITWLLGGYEPAHAEEVWSLRGQLHNTMIKLLEQGLQKDPQQRQPDIAHFLEQFNQSAQAHKGDERFTASTSQEITQALEEFAQVKHKQAQTKVLQFEAPPVQAITHDPHRADTQHEPAPLSKAPPPSKWPWLLLLVGAMSLGGGLYLQRHRADRLVTSSTCPSDMRLIPGGVVALGSASDDPQRSITDIPAHNRSLAAFCMDRLEFPNRSGQIPRQHVSFAEANALCQQEGKALCTEAQWEKACKGSEHWAYVYGAQPDARRCNLEFSDGTQRPVVPAGLFEACSGNYDVLDMAGNVGEWVQSEPQHTEAGLAIIKGGSANQPLWASRCSARHETRPGHTDAYIGFRCCRKQ